MKIFTFFSIVTISHVAASTLKAADDPREKLRSGEHTVTKGLQQEVSPNKLSNFSKPATVDF